MLIFENVGYGPKQVEFLLESAKILLPVCTGYLVLIAKDFPGLDRETALSKQRKTIVSLFLLALISIGLWCGVLAFMVDCAHPFDNAQAPGSVISQLDWEWNMGLRCAQLALISFFLSVIAYCSLFYEQKIKNRTV